MEKNTEKTIEKIKARIQSLSETAEYKVIRKLHELAFFGEKHYYTDIIENKARELDFLVGKSYGLPISGLELTLLGDVKFPVNYGKRIVVGLEQDVIDPYYFNFAKAVASTLFNIPLASSDIKFSIFTTFTDETLLAKFIDELLGFLIPCNQILGFKENGVECDEFADSSKKKKPFRVYCEQVISAFHARWHKLTKSPSVSVVGETSPQIKKAELVIPLLVFGNEIQFLSYRYDEDVLDKHSDALLYLFQSFSQSPDYIGYLTPIIITSLQKLPSFIHNLEQIIRRTLLPSLMESQSS